MKLSKKLLTVMIAVLMLLPIGAMTADAAYVSVHLTKTQTVNSSSNVHGTYKYFWGNNSSSSDHRVHFIARCKKGGIWVTDTSRTVGVGKNLSEIKTNVLGYETDWFIKLNPEGTNAKGCDAWGYIRNA